MGGCLCVIILWVAGGETELNADVWHLQYLSFFPDCHDFVADVDTVQQLMLVNIYRVQCYRRAVVVTV